MHDLLRRRHTHDLRSLELALEVQIIGTARADDDTYAVAVDVPIGPDRRGLRHQICALDQHVRCRVIHVDGARGIDGDEGHVARAGLDCLDRLRGRKNGDWLQRHVQALRELARQID